MFKNIKHPFKHQDKKNYVEESPIEIERDLIVALFRIERKATESLIEI